MIIVKGNLWNFKADWKIITVNGSIRKDGCAVLGRGCALEATHKYPQLQRLLGARIRTYGNRVHCFLPYKLLTFPVKHEWWEQADIDLIALSTHQLSRWIFPDSSYVMPRAGCGNGRLQWAVVHPILSRLPDNVSVIDF